MCVHVCVYHTGDNIGVHMDTHTHATEEASTRRGVCRRQDRLLLLSNQDLVAVPAYIDMYSTVRRETHTSQSDVQMHVVTHTYPVSSSARPGKTACIERTSAERHICYSATVR